MSFLCIAPASLQRLREQLTSHAPALAARILHDAGFATGEALAQVWPDRIRQRTGLDDPSRLDLRWFGPLLTEACRECGWGEATVSEFGDEALLLASEHWSEATPDGSLRPSCHFTAGALAAFLTRLAGAPIAVREVECRSAGKSGCAFVAGSPATIGGAWDLLAAGGDWRDAFAGARPG